MNARSKRRLVQVAVFLLVAVSTVPASAQRRGGLYGFSDETEQLMRIDPQTGETAPVGDVGFSECSAMTFAGRELFAVCRRADAEPVLVKIDPDYGTGTEVGPLGYRSSGEIDVVDMTLDHQDRLLALTEPQGLIWQLDPFTGRAELRATYLGLHSVSALELAGSKLFVAGEIGLSEIVAGYAAQAKGNWDAGSPLGLTSIPGSEDMMALVEGIEGSRLARVGSSWGGLEIVAETDPGLRTLAFHDPQRLPQLRSLEPPKSASGQAGAGPGSRAPQQRPPAQAKAAEPQPEISGPGTLRGELQVRVNLRTRIATWVLTVTNEGEHAQRDNPGDEIYIPAAGGRPLQGNNMTMNVQEGSISWNGEIEPGESVTLELQSQLPPLRPGVKVATQAVLHYDADGDGINESKTLSDDPDSSGELEPTEWAIPSLLGVLLRFGAGVVISLLVVVSFIVIARRRDWV